MFKLFRRMETVLDFHPYTPQMSGTNSGLVAMTVEFEPFESFLAFWRNFLWMILTSKLNVTSQVKEDHGMAQS